MTDQFRLSADCTSAPAATVAERSRPCADVPKPTLAKALAANRIKLHGKDDYPVYGHVLVCPTTFLNYNDAVLKASVLRAAKPSELMYEVDEVYSVQVAEIIRAELAGWDAGNGDALPEMLLALATGRLRLREIERSGIRGEALTAGLPPLLEALAQAIAA